MNTQIKLDRKIHRKYEVKYWWERDYNIKSINQNYINKIFKKFNIKGIIIQKPEIIKESDSIYAFKPGIIKTDLKDIINKNKFKKYVKLLDIYNYDILDETIKQEIKKNNEKYR